MIKIVLFLSLLVTVNFANPYKNISVEEQLTLFTNYFINEALSEKLPTLPFKGKPEVHEYNYKPTKYELYYNYVQRVKAIQDSIADEQTELDNKYKADIYKYNRKLKALKKFYEQEQNLYPIFTEAFNKAFKVVYGKPILEIARGEIGIQFFLNTEPVYNKNEFIPQPIVFNYAQEKKLFNFYEKCDLSVTFFYDNNILEFDEVVCSYQDIIYQGKVNQKTNEKIKLNVKINDDIFQQIKIPNGDKN